jgi:predicted DNA-binding transcriptional regulator YafY
MNRFDRALGILLLLRSGERWAAGDLAERFEVSIRTIYRDVDALGMLGIPVVAEVGRNGGFRLAEGYFLPPVMFTQGEAISLLLGGAMLRGLRAKPFAGELDSGEEKLLMAMPSTLRASLTNARKLIGFESNAPDAFHAPEPEQLTWTEGASIREGEIIQTFLGAVLKERAVEIRYSSPYQDVESVSVLSPRGLLADRDLWYLICQRPGNERAPRMLRADRVLGIRELTRPAEVDSAFDVRDWLNRAWLGDAMRQWENEDPVCLLVMAEQAVRLQQDWYYRHASITPSGDRFEVRFGQDKPELVFELLRWLGPGSELVEPVEWRDAFAESLRRMLDPYPAG